MVDPEPRNDTAPYNVESDTVRQLPLEFCRENHVVVLDQGESGSGTFRVGMLHPEDEGLVEEVSEELDAPVNPVQLNPYEIRRALSVGYDDVSPDVSETPELELSTDRDIEFSENLTPGDILRDVLSVAVSEGASDVHIENYRHEVDLRFRVDGVLHPVDAPVTSGNVDRVISKLKVMCQLDITDDRHAQDGRFTGSFRNSDGTTRLIDFRVSVVPGTFGEEVVIRILDRERFIFDMSHLGFTDDQQGVYEDLINHPGGMVLTVGPTASGKTTTLYTAILELSHEQKKILTVEDPIEYQFDRVNQKQVDSEMGFADYTRAFLRQNPDVMLIGEIRDQDTAEIAVRAANTGHLVLSTLHTGNAVMAISRLRSLDVNDDYLAEVLLGVISQRLVRTICPNCKTQVDPDPSTVRRFYSREPDHTFYDGEGCSECQGTGYQGREGVFEVLVVDEELQNLISEGTSTEKIRQYLEEAGFEPLYEHALRKVEDGITSLSEVARVISPPVERRELIRRSE